MENAILWKEVASVQRENRTLKTKVQSSINKVAQVQSTLTSIMDSADRQTRAAKGLASHAKEQLKTSAALARGVQKKEEEIAVLTNTLTLAADRRLQKKMAAVLSQERKLIRSQDAIESKEQVLEQLLESAKDARRGLSKKCVALKELKDKAERNAAKEKETRHPNVNERNPVETPKNKLRMS